MRHLVADLDLFADPPLVTKLNAIREERSQSALNSATPSSSTARAQEPNRVDTIIADVFSLISLMFLTVGKSRESPAIYCQITSMRVSANRPESVLTITANP
jgi:hypothetical protein